MSLKIDFLMPVGRRGGVENVVNMTALYLQNKGWAVRIVQLVWEHDVWVDERIAFHPLTIGREGHDVQELARASADFWDKNGLPDIILAVAWPYNSYISKQALWLYGEKRHETVDRLVISWLHAAPGEYERAGFGGYEALGFADAHFAISRMIATDISRETGSNAVFRVNNPVLINEEESTGIRDNGENCEQRLLFLGRISKEKHLETILRALAEKECVEWKLEVVGDGDDTEVHGVKELSEHLGLRDRVTWHGWQKRPWSSVKQITALVLASEYEGFPLVVIEALARGIPVIAPPLSGVAEIIVPGKNGYLFQVGHVEELSRILAFWAKGLLPEIDESYCRNSVRGFLGDAALGEFAKQLQDAYARFCAAGV